MNENRSFTCLTPFLLLCFVFATTSFGQTWLGEKPKLSTNHSINRGKYKILSHGLGIELQIDLEIKPRYRTDENYITIAKGFRERFCEEKQIRITYFESKKQWQILDPLELASTPLAIYYFGSKTDEVRLVVYKVVNGKVETRQVDLSHP